MVLPAITPLLPSLVALATPLVTAFFGFKSSVDRYQDAKQDRRNVSQRVSAARRAALRTQQLFSAYTPQFRRQLEQDISTTVDNQLSRTNMEEFGSLVSNLEKRGLTKSSIAEQEKNSFRREAARRANQARYEISRGLASFDDNLNRLKDATTRKIIAGGSVSPGEIPDISEFLSQDALLNFSSPTSPNNSNKSEKTAKKNTNSK